MLDVNNDGAKELVIAQLSNILVVDPQNWRVIQKIKIKPKAEGKAESFDRQLLQSISTESTLIERTSISGGLITKFLVYDIDGDSNPELIVLRADGIIACYDFRGKERWSMFLDPYITDISVCDVDNDDVFEIVAVSKGRMMYIIDSRKKVYRFYLADIFGIPAIIDCLPKGTDIGNIAILVRDGIIYLLRASIQKKVLRREEKIQTLNVMNLLKGGEPTAMYVGDVDGDQTIEFVVGFSNGDIQVLNSAGMEKLTISLEDRIAFVKNIGISEGLPLIICGDFMGNLVIFHGLKYRVIKGLPRRIECDVDGDGVNETISIIAKTLRIYKNKKEQLSIQGRSYITAFTLADVDNDDRKEIILGWNSRSLSVYDIDGQRIASLRTTTIPRVLILEDINSDGISELICGGEGTVEIYGV